jgi:hypothetical protein
MGILFLSFPRFWSAHTALTVMLLRLESVLDWLVLLLEQTFNGSNLVAHAHQLTCRGDIIFVLG